MKQLRTAVACALLTLSGAASADIFDLTLDPKGTVALGGTMLLISGTVTCDSPNFFFGTSIFGNAIQISVGGKVVSRAFVFGSAQCAGAVEPVPYTLQANTSGGSPFKPGHANVSVTAQQFVCTPFGGCNFFTKTVAQNVLLNP